jgi:uncharacterized protein (DUF58 family)
VSLAASVGDSEEFLALRDYRPGDPLQRIHWKSFARAGKPVVKQYQDEFFERHVLVLDTAAPRSEDAAFEEAIALAASFVYTIDTHECLLDLLFVGGSARPGESSVRAYTAGRGQLQAEHMLEVLAAAGASAPGEFDALARSVMARRAQLSSCILVLLSWDEARARLVAALGSGEAQVRVLLVCPRGAAPRKAPASLVVLHPGEIEKGLLALR